MSSETLANIQQKMDFHDKMDLILWLPHSTDCSWVSGAGPMPAGEGCSIFYLTIEETSS